MSFEIIGLLHEKFDIQQINENFRKREFILEHIVTRNEKKIIDYIKFQLTGDRCNHIEALNLGDTVKVFFNIKGRKFEKEENTSYFLNLDVWRLESIDNSNTTEATIKNEKKENEFNDYLPF